MVLPYQHLIFKLAASKPKFASEIFKSITKLLSTMKICENQNAPFFVAAFLFLFSLSGCLTSKKMDAYVAEKYGNQLPKQSKKMKSEIVVTSAIPLTDNKISKTIKRTSKVLPLIVYWQFDYRHTCVLNPNIAVSNFSNTINAMSGKLSQKLNGQQLELTVEQVPSAFAIVDKGHMVLLVNWDRVYVEPDGKDLVVSYKILQNNNEVKTGKIDIKSLEQNRNVRFAQSWRSSTSEYLAGYNANITTMSKAFVAKLLEEM
jgi:hypothetical protein